MCLEDVDIEMDNLIPEMSDELKPFAEFNNADWCCFFSFSSGLPASSSLSVSELIASPTLLPNRYYWAIVYELIKVITFIIFPLKNLALVVRSFTRWCSGGKRKQETSYKCALISLGPENRASDRYFGPLASELEQVDYIKIVPGLRVGLKNDFKYVEAGLGASGLLWTVFGAFVFTPVILAYVIISRLRINCVTIRNLYTLMALRELASSSAFSTWIICESLKQYVARKGLARITFPFEGRTWERNLVKVCKKNKICSVGYLHCALTPRHIPLLYPRLFYKDNQIPEQIIAPGNMPYKLMSKTFGEKAVVIDGLFLRASPKKQTDETDRNKIVVALTGSVAESKLILDAVGKSSLLSNYKVIIRLNRATSTYNQIRSYMLSMNLSDADNTHNLPMICLFRSSSVAVDCLHMGIWPCYMRINGELSNNTFDLDKYFPIDEIALDKDFDSQFKKCLANLSVDVLEHGKLVSNYYLDQSNDKIKYASIVKVIAGSH